MSDEAKPNTASSTGKPGTEGAGTGPTLAELRNQYEAALGRDAQGKDKGNVELTALRAQVEKLNTAEADRSYRKEMVRVLTFRALSKVLDLAHGEKTK